MAPAPPTSAQIPPASGRSPGGGHRSRWKDTALAYLLLLPSALILGAFAFVPLVNALLLSLREWKLVPGGFVGLENYRRVLTADPDFWRAIIVTVYYAVGIVPTTIVLGYLVAELLHTRVRGLPFYRTLFFTPYVVSPVAVAAVWGWMLNPNFGVLTAAADRFGWHPRWLGEPRGIVDMAAAAMHAHVPQWAGGPSLAQACIIAVTVWQNLGFAVVVLLAGLASVPADVIEAARLDGASGWRLLRSVKLPLVSPTLFFLLIVFTIRSFQMFTPVFVLSIDNAGGPAYTTRNITLYIYQTFNTYQPRLGPGYGSAVAMILFLIILALTLVQFSALGRRVHYG